MHTLHVIISQANFLSLHKQGKCVLEIYLLSCSMKGIILCCKQIKESQPLKYEEMARRDRNSIS